MLGQPKNIQAKPEPAITRPALVKSTSATSSSTNLRKSQDNLLLSNKSANKQQGADLHVIIEAPSAPTSPFTPKSSSGFDSPINRTKVVFQNNICPYPLNASEIKADMNRIFKQYHEINQTKEDQVTTSPSRDLSMNYQQVLTKIALATVVSAPYAQNRRPYEPNDLVIDQFEPKLNEDYQMTFQKSKFPRTDQLEIPKRVKPIKYTQKKRSSSVPQTSFPQEEIRKIVYRNNNRFRAFASWYVNAPKAYTPIFDLEEQMKIENEALKNEEEKTTRLFNGINAKIDEVNHLIDKNESEQFAIAVEINKIKSSTLELDEVLYDIKQNISEIDQNIKEIVDDHKKKAQPNIFFMKYQSVEYKELQGKLQTLQKEVNDAENLYKSRMAKIDELTPEVSKIENTLDQWSSSAMKLQNERLHIQRRMHLAEVKKREAQEKLAHLKYMNSLQVPAANQAQIQKLTQEANSKQQEIIAQAKELAAK